MLASEEHMYAVAKRRAKRLKTQSEEEWVQDLVNNCYWSKENANQMLKIAKRHLNSVDF